MAYEPRYDDEIRNKIVAYVQDRFAGLGAQLEAIDHIEEALKGLAQDPIRLGKRMPGPFPGLQAVLQVGPQSPTRHVIVRFTFSEDEKFIDIIDFKPLAL